ncbi:MAG: type IV conjugative transfer system lipoprotein TraV [Nitrosomonas sp.]|uniref:Conjugal transfer pilus assembly protein TraV n=1 Tax=Nitrosomonas aestuarii TaxID=52441 RepID=A0A1I4DJD4_9PROT|nr:type IV conjugative transfer system lipoprotein TraV [Nitrosomonas aestuarii]MBX3630299.1 type IV conjugative transfer system lipoprotein TraV [Nitrosomonas sp.]SFK93622.1 conjugal transfer pilus assembly protein TraV [Nitrosomonas aestuarii]
MDRFIAVLIIIALSGCTTLTGLDSTNKFACRAPDGVSCSSLSGVYANAVDNNLPGLAGTSGTISQEGRKNDSEQPGTIVGVTPKSGTPVRSQTKIMRVWIAPWEDSEGDLHDQSYVYVVVDLGQWNIAHSKSQIINMYRPVQKSELSESQQQEESSASVTRPVNRNHPLSANSTGMTPPGMNGQSYGYEVIGEFPPYGMGESGSYLGGDY